MDSELRFTRIDKFLARFNGHPPAAHIGKTLRDMVPEVAGQIEPFYRSVIESGEPVLDVVATDVHPDELRHYRASYHPVKDARGQAVGVFSVVEDITERAKLAEQLRHAGKMDAVGRMAGGVAHDFNNILAGMLGNLGLLKDDLSRQGLGVGQAREDLDAIGEAIKRASALTDQLLTVSRKRVLKAVVLDVNERLRQMASMLERVVQESIEFHVALQPDLKNVRMDASEFEQLIMNLVLNARDAMPHGGQLHLETCSVNLDADRVGRYLNAAPGPYVRISVCDDGSGMDERVRSRAFEPFYTTKDKGKGTGLGLSTVHGILQRAHGDLCLESAPGDGTCVHLFLPETMELPEVPAARAPSRSAKSQGETLMLVEDEEMVRRALVRSLAREGYRVLEAANGRAALALLEQHGSSVKLLITDVVMPGISGPELAKRVVAQQPEIRVLFLSGYAGDSLDEWGDLEPGRRFLRKPFDVNDLFRSVRETLDAVSP
jgi:PAS domain S-box-containing protein